MALESPARVNGPQHWNDELAQAAVKAKRSPWTTAMFRGRTRVETGASEVGGEPKGMAAAKPSEGKALRTIDVDFPKECKTGSIHTPRIGFKRTNTTYLSPEKAFD